MKKRMIMLLLMTLAVMTNMEAEVVYSGEHSVGSWNAKQLPVGDYAVLAKASAGDVIAVTLTAVEDGARITLQDSGWQGMVDEYNCAVGKHYFALTEAMATKLNEGGLIVTGEKYTFDKVELLYKKTLWEGTVDDNTGWTQSDALDNSIFASLTEGSLLGINVTAINDGASWHQTALRANYEGLLGSGVSEAGILLFELTAAQTSALQVSTIDITAQYLCVSTLFTWIETEENGEDAGEATILWNGSTDLGDWGNLEDLRYDGKGDLANVKVGDVIRVTFSHAAEGWQVYVCDAASYSEFDNGYFDGSAQDEPQWVNFKVTTATVLEAIRDRGIVIKGKMITLTKVERITYNTSYNAAAITIGETGYATWSSSKCYDFADTGIKVYFASDIASGIVTMTSITTTWGYQGYLVKGAAGTYTIPETEEENASYPSGNYLKATSDYASDLTASTEGAYRYIFSKKDEKIGFFKLTNAYTLAAHKAYLETTTDVTPTSGNARISLLFNDETTTGIGTVQLLSTAANRGFYDLQGRKVADNRLQSGLYIHNGKKYIVK